MITETTDKLNMQINRVGEQIASIKDKPIASTIETRTRNYSRN
jgi:hypothetical protein